MTKCPYCGAEVDPVAEYCEECGNRIPPVKECPRCHAQVKVGVKCCSKCGYSFLGQNGAGPSLAMGDKNVVAGDVIGNKDDYHVMGNATFIKNEDETKRMVQCHICGKHLLITCAFTCPVCNKITCHECYDKATGSCIRCASQRVREKENEYRALLEKVYAAGKVDLAGRRMLNQLMQTLGIKEERARELEVAVRDAASSEETSLGVCEEMYCTQAAEELWGKGDALAALRIIEPVYKNHPHEAKVLSVYFPAMALIDEDGTLRALDAVSIDSESIDSTRIDIDLRHGDFAAAEVKLKSAIGRWPESVTIRCRKALCLYMAFVTFGKSEALSAAMEIVEGLPTTDDKGIRTWVYYLKCLFSPNSKARFPKVVRERYQKAGIYQALACGDIFGVRPILVDEVVEKALETIGQGKDELLAADELSAIKRAADNGDVAAGFIIGLRCVRQNSEYWVADSLAQTDSVFAISRMCALKSSQRQSISHPVSELLRGLDLIKAAAKAGLVEAQYAFAQYVDRGDVEGESSLEWYRRAASQGHAASAAKVSEYEAFVRAEKKAQAERMLADEKSRMETERKAAYERAAPLRAFLQDGLVKLPDLELRIGKTQVTQAVWSVVMGVNPSTFKGANRPVETVSIVDCLKFIETLNDREEVKSTNVRFRLPTKEEWRKACGAVGRSHVQFGLESYSASTNTAWTWENSNRETHTVAQKKPTSLGLFDMYGNVAEWCTDEDRGRVICLGGGFLTGCEDCEIEDAYRADDRLCCVGMRLVAYEV